MVEKNITEGIVKINGNTINYARIGSKKKNFVIIPGLSVRKITPAARAIAAQYSAFLENYTIWVFDRPDIIGEGCTIQKLAEETIDAMKVLNIEKAIFFGASQGGMIAQSIAVICPEITEGLILGSTAPCSNETAVKTIGGWADMARKKDENALLNSFTDNVYSPKNREIIREAVFAGNSNITDEEFRKFAILSDTILNFDNLDRIKDIHCPVLVIGCENDRVLSGQASVEIANALKCELFMYEGDYGHGVFDEAPDYAERCFRFANGI